MTDFVVLPYSMVILYLRTMIIGLMGTTLHTWALVHVRSRMLIDLKVNCMKCKLQYHP